MQIDKHCTLHTQVYTLIRFYTWTNIQQILFGKQYVKNVEFRSKINLRSENSFSRFKLMMPTQISCKLFWFPLPIIQNLIYKVSNNGKLVLIHMIFEGIKYIFLSRDIRCILSIENYIQGLERERMRQIISIKDNTIKEHNI